MDEAVASGDARRPEVVARPRRASAVLAVAVGLVLADSSIVVLALPELYRQLDVSVTAVAWVLISFNLVFALAALPAAHAARRLGPARVTVTGLVAFALASLGCGLAGAIAPLIAARCVQAAGGAAAVCGALELLPAALGSERRAAASWAGAGAIGAALGPAAGGLLTELVAWQSIFLLQVPLGLALVVALAPTLTAERRGGVAAELRPAGRPHLAANAALSLISAALAAALFLLVLLLIEGWLLSPIAAALTVSVIPVAALAGGRLAPRSAGNRARAAAGAILIAGGLGGLALLPAASVAATLAPQVLIGVGLALALGALTAAALAGRAPQAIHGGWTIAARHAGVVAGLLILTPLFVADLETEREQAEQAGVAAVLDARIDPSAKLALAERIADRLAAEGDKVPDLRPAFEPLPSDPGEREAVIGLRADLAGELDRAATHAFSRSFAVAAGFALAALVAIAIARRRVAL